MTNLKNTLTKSGTWSENVIIPADDEKFLDPHIAGLKMYRNILKCSNLVANELGRDLQSLKYPLLQKFLGKERYVRLTLIAL